MDQKDFKCIVYYFQGAGADAMDKLRFDIVTHVNYAFAIPTAEGHLRPLEEPELARAVIAKAHANGAKACLSVGGWSYQDIPLEATFREGTNTPEKIRTLTREILSVVEEFQFDGVDVDWEYPRVADGSKAQYEALIGALAAELKPMGKLLTVAVFAGVDSKGAALQDVSCAQDRPSFDKLDWMNLMTYDCDGPKHSTYEFAENCAEYWVNTRGFEGEKLTLGLPFYGRPAPGAYKKLLEIDPDALEKDMVVADGKEIWHNGRDTLQKKVAMAKRYGMGGVMVWEIGEDAQDREKSLLTVLGQAMK